MKLVIRAFIYLLLALTAVAAGIGVFTYTAGQRSVPVLNGEAHLPGLAAAVTVLSDDAGIVTIRAESMSDAYRALGYLHARDRLWQMETMRRIGSGRMAEIVGPPMLSYDRMMRELSLRRQAERQEALLSDAERADMQAYADGVNAFLKGPRPPLPIEFQLTWHEPEPWTIADSLLWGRLMSLQLSGDAFGEAFHEALAGKIGWNRIDQLLPRNRRGPTTMNDRNRDAWIGEYDASNAWAIAGRHTASRKPILANDPHLGLRMPGQWYLARIETPELTLVGATAPGVPLHILGHNGTIAWGLTTTHADTQDAVRLTRSDLDTAKTRHEEIRVRFSGTETIEIRETEFGPVLSRFGQTPPHALHWTGTEPDQRTASALYKLNRARSWNDFIAALALFDDPVQNVFYADTGGRIGMKVVGRLPIRISDATGTIPTEAGTPEARWHGIVPSGDLPGLVDPVDGIIANANNRVVGAEYPYSISHKFTPEYRAVRLHELLEDSLTDHDPNASTRLQLDTLSVAARRLTPQFLTAVPGTPIAKDALSLLETWDHRMDRGSAAAAIYMTMLNETVRLLAEDDLGAEAFETFWRADARFVEKILFSAPEWCDDTRTGPVENCRWVLSTALDRAVSTLKDHYGPAASQWRWGDLHAAPMEHFLLNLVPGLAAIGNRPTATDGGDHTLNRGQSRGGAGPTPFNHIHGAGYRAVYDLSDLDQSLFALAGGQSGNPFSPHYDDLLDDWRDGRYFRIPGRAGDIRNHTDDVLHLRP